MKITPTENVNTQISINVEPTVESETILSIISMECMEVQDSLLESQKNVMWDYDVSSVDLIDNSLPYKTRERIKMYSHDQWKIIYEKELFEDYTLQEAFDEYIGNSTYDCSRIFLDNDNINYNENTVEVEIGGELIVLKTEDEIPDFEEWNTIYLLKNDMSAIKELDKITGRNTSEYRSEWELVFDNFDKRSYKKNREIDENIVRDIERLSKNPRNLNIGCQVVNNGYFTASRAKMLVLLLNNSVDSILFKASWLTIEIIESLIESFNLEYEHIPQKGQIILSNTEIPFENNHFEKNFPSKQKLLKEEAEKIYEFIGVPTPTIERLKTADTYEKYTKIFLEEMEILESLKKAGTINYNKINHYMYSPNFSDGSRESMISVLEEGKEYKKELFKISDKIDSNVVVEEIIHDLDTSMFYDSNKLYDNVLFEKQ